MGTRIDITAADGGRFKGYLAEPSGTPRGGIVVIQEIFGVNAVMRTIADNLAAQGYLALAPDLFWRIEPGIDITDQTDAEWQKAFSLYNAFDVDAGVNDIQATLTALGGRGTTKAGAVGYCLGGLLAYLTAARTDADCSVSYYGVGIEGRLDEAAAIRKPLMLHIAEKDAFVPAAAQEQIVSGLKSHPQVTIHTYPGQDHAFARTGGKHYDATAANLEDGRTSAFFREFIG